MTPDTIDRIASGVTAVVVAIALTAALVVAFMVFGTSTDPWHLPTSTVTTVVAVLTYRHLRDLPR